SGRSFSEEIQSLESDLIKHSLETNEGSVTRAANNLGISYQELNYMLDTRHRDLVHLRTPARRRSRKEKSIKTRKRLFFKNRQIRFPWSNGFTVLLRHHADDLPDVAEIVDHPR